MCAGITTESSRIVNKSERLIAKVGRSARRHYYYLWMHQVGLCSEDLMSFGKAGRIPYISVKSVLRQIAPQSPGACHVLSANLYVH